jgi:hypothetical protein
MLFVKKVGKIGLEYCYPDKMKAKSVMASLFLLFKGFCPLPETQVGIRFESINLEL